MSSGPTQDSVISFYLLILSHSLGFSESVLTKFAFNDTCLKQKADAVV